MKKLKPDPDPLATRTLMPKTKRSKEKVEEVAQRTGLDIHVVRGVLSDLARTGMGHKHKESLNVIAKRWGMSVSNLVSTQNMSRIVIDDYRDMMASKMTIVANTYIDAVMDDANDPVKLAAMDTKTKMSIAKQSTDAVGAWQKTEQNSTQNNQINIGEIKMLISNKAERSTMTAVERLKAAGVSEKALTRASLPAPEREFSKSDEDGDDWEDDPVLDVDAEEVTMDDLVGEPSESDEEEITLENL